MDAFNLKNKVMVITGGTRGIGRGLVNYFVEQGVQVAAIGSNEESAKRLSKEMAKEGHSVRTYALDVRNVSGIQPVFDRIAKDFGGIDILVNCAGMGNPIPAIDVTQEDWDTMMDLNLRGCFFCSQAAAKHMLPKKYGRIINVSSQLSLVANENESVYCASKGGLNNLTRCLSYEWSKNGVIVTAVAPTFIYTPGTAERLNTPSFRENVMSRIPRGRLGNVTDVGVAIHYLASDYADMASGSCLVIDGGWTIV